MSMQRRHEEMLKARLELLEIQGTCFIAWNELYVWFGQSKITKKTWREIWDMWVGLTLKEGELKEDYRLDPKYQTWCGEHEVDMIEGLNTGGVTLINRRWVNETPLSMREFV